MSNLYYLYSSIIWRFCADESPPGISLGVMMGIIKKHMKKQSAVHKWIWRIAAIVIAGYGILAFLKRDIGSYMFLKNQFVFFNFEEPLILFLLDYVSIMGLFVFISHYFAAGLRRMQQKKLTGKI